MSSTFKRKGEKTDDKNKFTYVSNHNKYKRTKTMKVCFSSPRETKKLTIGSLQETHLKHQDLEMLKVKSFF